MAEPCAGRRVVVEKCGWARSVQQTPFPPFSLANHFQSIPISTWKTQMKYRKWVGWRISLFMKRSHLLLKTTMWEQLQQHQGQNHFTPTLGGICILHTVSKIFKKSVEKQPVRGTYRQHIGLKLEDSWEQGPHHFLKLILLWKPELNTSLFTWEKCNEHYATMPCVYRIAKQKLEREKSLSAGSGTFMSKDNDSSHGSR